MLGEFEYLLLTAASTGRSCSIGALYTTLGRLEEKGFVKTSMGDPTPERGGRPKRMVHVTGKGIQAATEFYNAVTSVTRGASWANSGGSNIETIGDEA
jgi:DNA-binding PadR family transcriptional regulator